MNQPIVDVLLPLALGFIMFSLGLTLSLGDFARLLARPRAMAVGLAGQVVLVPLVAFAVASLSGLPPAMAAGLMIVAASPGGASSGLITHLARGDTALSISLTAVTSLASVATLPLVLDASLRHFLGTGVASGLPVGTLVRGVFFLATVPVALGMVVRARRPALTARIGPVTERIATALFLLIVLATFASQRQTLVDNFATVGPAALLHNVAVMAMGFGLAATGGLALRDRIAISIECGLHNAAVGIFIAATVLHSPEMTVPSVVYALLMNLTAICLIVFMRRRRPACATG
ncbi:MAG TPA: bile acid:sodium symporter family protein [Rhodocyclaceae bacterium]